MNNHSKAERHSGNVFNQEEYTTADLLLNHLLLAAKNRKLVFRGVSDLSQLKPTINRVNNRSSNFQYKDVSYLEFSLLYDFKKYASAMLNGNLDLLDIVAYAQHFGLPTRLVDWTRDPFVALYFAINQSECPLDGYRLFYTNLDDHILINRSYGGLTHGNMQSGSEFIEEYHKFIKSIINKQSLIEELKARSTKLKNIGIIEDVKTNPDGLLFYECNASNPRLIAQQGLFSIPCSILNEDAQNEIIKKAEYITIRIDKKVRNELLRLLDNMNYSNLRLFPDIQSIAEYILISNINKGELLNF